jgi:hypothetical protein
MNGKLSVIKSIVVAAALAAGVSGSEWRQSHPNGLSARELQALSSEGPVWHPTTRPTTSAVASTNATGVAKTAAK